MPTLIRAAGMAGVALGLTGVTYAAGFEGVVHVKNTHEAYTSEMDWYAKGEQGRMETQTPDGRKRYWIVDGKNRRWIYPIPDQKMYHEMSFDEVGDVEPGDTQEESKYDFIRTGKKDTVAGYPCEILLTKSKETGKTKAESCVATGMGYFFMGGPSTTKSGQRREHKWMKELREQFKDGAFPLRTTVYRDDGTEEMRMEVTKVEKKRLDDSLFAVPAGYKKFDMAEMMRGKGVPPGAAGAKPGGMPGRKGASSEATGPETGQSESRDVNVDALMKNLGDMLKQGAGNK